MRGLAKLSIYALACLYCSAGYSQALIPGSPSVIVGGDDVRGRDGTTCRQGTYAKPTIDFGVTSANAGVNSSSTTGAGNVGAQVGSNTNNSVGVYFRIVVPLGKDPARIDCTQLYALEIERLRAELERLKSTGSAAVQVQ